MTEHPITPPPVLVAILTSGAEASEMTEQAYIATQAARWGADQQLDQCVAWLDGYLRDGWAAGQMRNDCRPKPPSLKEQALADLDSLVSDLKNLGMGFKVTNIIRALEALDD